MYRNDRGLGYWKCRNIHFLWINYFCVFLGGKIQPITRKCALSLILCGMTCASVAVVTSRGGPGAQVGNLYFASWIAFIVSLILLGHCMGDFCGHAPKDDDDYAAGDDSDDASEEKSVEKAESDEMPGMLEA
mmetsp:Transcript_12512/g.19363  ORF Transcript_12512/g.19363 Transcript_12512/m.19363 type:complete len:132 (+) Transcript_12512:684-1079(+)